MYGGSAARWAVASRPPGQEDDVPDTGAQRRRSAARAAVPSAAVEVVRDDTHGADRELRSAARYQKNARSKACCLLVILTIILTIILLAVFLG